MKKLFTMMVAACALSACGAGMNKINCRQAVVEEFKSADVVALKEYKFIVRDAAGNVWLVETMNMSDTKITAKTLIFTAK